ncbi:MAG: hypothetical protein CMP95_10035 [Gammaproteobacteria bacterium]|nr:hypothetical protein [Gammaproteobacteria bacterium]OUV67335.1 MAG: hypothetical protein CBC93_05705 [Gammaproteobacteria bacterium TMED133]
MHIQELETIKYHNMNILIVVMNNGAYSQKVDRLRLEELSESGSVLGNTDFAGIVQGFGLMGKTMTRSNDIGVALSELLNKHEQHFGT